MGLPCHSLSAPRVPTPLQDSSLRCRSLTAHYSHCCAFALLFLARPLHCCSQQRLRRVTQFYAIASPSISALCLRRATQIYAFSMQLSSLLCPRNSSPLYAIPFHIRSMQFPSFSRLCFAVALLCSALPLLCQAALFRYNSLLRPRKSIASRVRAIPLQFIALQHYSARCPRRSELCFSIACQLEAVPSPNATTLRNAIPLLRFSPRRSGPCLNFATAQGLSACRSRATLRPLPCPNPPDIRL